MAVDYSILSRVPSIGSRISSGMEAGREAAVRNQLLARQNQQFEQAQQDRARALQREQQQDAAYEQIAGVLRQAGQDPDNPAVLQQLTAEAFKSRNPQVISAVSLMNERAAKRRQAADEAKMIADIRARRQGAVPGAVPSAVPGAMPAVPATGAAPLAGNMLAPKTATPANALPTAVTPTPTAPNAARLEQLERELAAEEADRAVFSGLSSPAAKTAVAQSDARIRQLMRQIEKAQPKQQARSEFFQLQDELRNLPPGDPGRKAVEARMAKLTEPSKGVTVEVPIAIYDPDTKTVRYVPRSEAIGKTPASAAPKEKPEKEPPVSAQQAATATARLLQRTNEIFTVLKNAPTAEAPGALEAAVGATPGISGAVNLLRGTERQIVASAQDDILDSLLYLATGAAYNKEQLQQQKNAYLANWSDTPQTRAVKRQRLVDMIGNAKIRAGAAWTPELDAQMQNLLGAVSEDAARRKGEGAGGAERPAPKGVDPEDWKFMTPEERKLWP